MQNRCRTTGFKHPDKGFGRPIVRRAAEMLEVVSGSGFGSPKVPMAARIELVNFPHDHCRCVIRVGWLVDLRTKGLSVRNLCPKIFGRNYRELNLGQLVLVWGFEHPKWVPGARSSIFARWTTTFYAVP